MKLRRIAAVVAAAFCAIAAVSLVRELVALGPERVLSLLGRQRPGVVVGALALVAVNYFVLTCQDQLAFVYVGRRLARWRIRLASFVESFAKLWLDAAPRICTERNHGRAAHADDAVGPRPRRPQARVRSRRAPSDVRA